MAAPKKGSDKIIFLSSSPLFMPTGERVNVLDTESEWHAMRTALEKSHGLDVEIEHRPLTQKSLRDAVREDPLILQLSGHGEVDLILPEGSGEQADLGLLLHKSEFFDDSFQREERNLKLVILTDCHSESFADVFLRLGVPCVICVQADQTLIDYLTPVFTGTLFEALAKHNKLNVAVMMAQDAVSEVPLPPIKYENPTDHQGKPRSPRPGDLHFVWVNNIHEQEAEYYKLVPEGSPFLRMELFPEPQAGAPAPAPAPAPSRVADLTWVIPHNKLDPMTSVQWKRFREERERYVGRLLSNSAGGTTGVSVLTGHAGMGKTFVLKRLAYYSLSRRKWFPGGVFYVRRSHKAKPQRPVAFDVVDALRNALPQPLGKPPGKLADGGAALAWVVATLQDAAKAGKGPVLLVLDDMDDHRVEDPNLGAMLAAVRDAGKATVRLVIGRRDPLGPKAAAEAQKLNIFTIAVEPLTDRINMFHFLKKPREGEDQNLLHSVNQWNLKHMDDDRFWTTISGGNPGLLDKIRTETMVKKEEDFRAFMEHWRTKNKNPASGEVHDFTQPAGARHYFGAGHRGDRRFGRRRGRWHTVDERAAGFTDEDDDDDRDYRRDTRHRHYREDSYDRDHEEQEKEPEHESRQQRKLRKLKKEHQALLKENKRLKTRVRDTERFVERVQAW